MKTLKYILGRDECQYIISIKGDRLLFELNKQIGDRLHFELNGCHCERSEAISPWCHCEERSDVAILHIANLAHFSSKKNNSIFSFHATVLSSSRLNVKEVYAKNDIGE